MTFSWAYWGHQGQNLCSQGTEAMDDYMPRAKRIEKEEKQWEYKWWTDVYIQVYTKSRPFSCLTNVEVQVARNLSPKTVASLRYHEGRIRNMQNVNR